LWIDQLTVAENAEIPALLLERLLVKPLKGVENIDYLIQVEQPVAVLFDFDYPDRKCLSTFEKFKRLHQSTPAVFITMQHSERLAVWAFRNGALDYLVKPITDGELGACIDRICDIAAIKVAQSTRAACLSNAHMPNEIPSTSGSKKKKLAPAIFFVRQNYSQRIYSDAMARLCGMSATQFSRAFKQTFKMTFQEFLLRYRIRRACHQLRNPEISIMDAAYAVGFSDPSYFTRVFRRCMGQSPSEYCNATSLNTTSAANDDVTGEFLASSSQIIRSLAKNMRG
jgi:AraC-like DNA-binding protein